MAKIKIENVNDAIFYYPRYFNKPSEVLKEDTLSKTDKIRILESWKQDIELEEVAEEENMHSSAASILDEVTEALHFLQAPGGNTRSSPPTKFG